MMFFGLGEIKPSHMCRGRPIADAARGAPHILSDPVRQIITHRHEDTLSGLRQGFGRSFKLATWEKTCGQQYAYPIL